MNRIDDPRLEFYLKHQVLIEEWASIKDDVQHAAIEFYESLATDLETEAAAIGDQILVVRKDGSFGHVGFADQAWLLDDDPRVAIMLEWQRSTASFDSGWRAIGVRVDLDIAGGKELRSSIADRIRSKRKALGFPSSSIHWPAYATVPRAEGAEYWKDLQPYRQHLITALLSAWDVLAEDVAASIADNPVTPL